jgi:hypothetical protein
MHNNDNPSNEINIEIQKKKRLPEKEINRNQRMQLSTVREVNEFG